MNLSKVFAFDENVVRVAGTPEKPLFVAADICRVLEIKNHRDAVNEFEEDEEKTEEKEKQPLRYFRFQENRATTTNVFTIVTLKKKDRDKGHLVQSRECKRAG